MTEIATPHLQVKREELLARRDVLIESFTGAASRMQGGRMKRVYRNICQTNEFLLTLEKIGAETGTTKVEGLRRYVVGSLFLYECFEKLTADDKEQFVFITGSEVDGVMVLDQVIELHHDTRTAGGVKANPRSTHKILIKLEQFRQRLLAHFHSHPGLGPGGTHPSGTDESFQQRLEDAGHVALAAIFSRDGYVRFFRMDGNLKIEIHGAGVEECEPNVFRLTNLDQA